MKKNIAFFICVIIMAFSFLFFFVGCDNNKTNTKDTEYTQEDQISNTPQPSPSATKMDISELSDNELDNLIIELKQRQEYKDEIKNYKTAKEKYDEQINKIFTCEKNLETAEYNLSVAYEIIKNNPEYNNDPSYLQGHIDLVEQRKQELIVEQGKLENFEQPVNECVEGMSWEDVITALERGNATNQSILDILNTNYELHLGGAIPAWYESILRTIRISTGIDITKTTL